MADSNTTPAARRSPVGAVAATIGVLLLAYGLTGLAFGGGDFGTDPGGTVDGETWLGIEGNGWTNLLFIGAGALLIVSAPTRVGAIAAATLSGLALATAAVIALFDGDDVFGVFAANGWTMLAWGGTAIALLALALAPTMTRGNSSRTVAGPPRDPQQGERGKALEREPLGPRDRAP